MKHNSQVNRITAVTEVFPDGRRCVAAVLEYAKEPLHANLEDYLVEGRQITDVKKEGAVVTISLSPDDEAAKLYVPGEPWENVPARLIPAKIMVQQVKDLMARDGSLIPAAKPDENDRERNLLEEEFVTGSFEGLAYNLFIPRNYDPSVQYPLVQFIHDAAVCGPQTGLTLAQGHGALSFMTPEAQSAHACFVLAPQYDMPAIVDDDWNVDHRLEVGRRLLDQIVSQYSIDPNRLYTTGESMGCMSSMVLNLRNPDYFAASYFVAGQWDERAFRGAELSDKHFWFICSQGDAKAFPGMNQILCVLEREGAKIAREVWRADWSGDVYSEKAKALIDTGANIIYTPYEITSVANGWHSDGGEHHVNTWRTAYDIEAVRDWLFAQHK